MVFVLTFVLEVKTLFLRRFILKSAEGTQALLRQDNRNFHNSSPFERLACFCVKITGNSERFQFFNFETNFLKNKYLFQKTGYRFLVESTKIENAIFLYKTAMSECLYCQP